MPSLFSTPRPFSAFLTWRCNVARGTPCRFAAAFFEVPTTKTSLTAAAMLENVHCPLEPPALDALKPNKIQQHISANSFVIYYQLSTAFLIWAPVRHIMGTVLILGNTWVPILGKH